MKKQLFAFILSCSLSLPGMASTLFVLSDAGETNALLPVIQKMRDEGQEIEVLAMGTARDLVKKAHCQAEELEQIDRNYPREQTLPESDIQTWVQNHPSTVVVTGVASAVQGQFLKAYQSQARTYAFWDNFNSNGVGSYFETAKKVQSLADKVLLPSEMLAHEAIFKDRDVKVVGQPTLEIWKERVENMDRGAIYEKLNLNVMCLPIFTYIGGYGPESEASLKMFAEGVKDLAAVVILQPHPRSDGTFERQFPDFILSTVSAEESVSISDAVITYNSTVGFQALSLQKNVIFAIPEGDSYTNRAVERGWAKKVSRPSGFFDAFLDYQDPCDIFQEMGIPKNSVSLIVSTLREK